MTAAGGSSPLARARAAALDELRRVPQAVSWRRQAAMLVATQVGVGLLGVGAALGAGLARPSDLLPHLLTIAPLIAVAALGAIAALAPRPAGSLVTWQLAALAAAPAAMAAVVLARGAGAPSASPQWVCSASHLGIGIMPLAFALVGLRQSARSWTGALAAGLGAGTTGALLGELACHRGARHVLVYHLGRLARARPRLRGDLPSPAPVHVRAVNRPGHGFATSGHSSSTPRSHTTCARIGATSEPVATHMIPQTMPQMKAHDVRSRLPSVTVDSA